MNGVQLVRNKNMQLNNIIKNIRLFVREEKKIQKLYKNYYIKKYREAMD